MEEEFGQTYARKQIERQQNRFRKFIKSFYITRVLQYIEGSAIDLGCGAGQILERLPSGSIGIETNAYLVEHLTQQGLKVLPAVEDKQGFNLNALRPNEFRTLILSHVLEHFRHADQVLRKLFFDCARLGISTVIIVVPGEAGFRSDATHKTFVDMDYLQNHQVLACAGYKAIHHSYFPGNVKNLGKFFAYHELMLVYRRLQ